VNILTFFYSTFTNAFWKFSSPIFSLCNVFLKILILTFYICGKEKVVIYPADGYTAVCWAINGPLF